MKNPFFLVMMRMGASDIVMRFSGGNNDQRISFGIVPPPDT